MRRYARDLLLILALASLWAGSGFAIGAALEAIGINNYPLSAIFASLNLILGMSLFLGVTKDPTANRVFFEGPRPSEPGRWSIGCLWLMPVGLLFFGLLMGLWTIVLHFILK